MGYAWLLCRRLDHCIYRQGLLSSLVWPCNSSHTSGLAQEDRPVDIRWAAGHGVAVLCRHMIPTPILTRVADVVAVMPMRSVVLPTFVLFNIPRTISEVRVGV